MILAHNRLNQFDFSTSCKASPNPTPQSFKPFSPASPPPRFCWGVSLLPGNGGPGLWRGSEGCLEGPGGAGSSLPLRQPRLPGAAAAPGSLRRDPPLRVSGRRAGRGRARGHGEPVPHEWVPRARRGPAPLCHSPALCPQTITQPLHFLVCQMELVSLSCYTPKAHKGTGYEVTHTRAQISALNPYVMPEGSPRTPGTLR